MRCIFCKCDSTASKSVEHILPESLGNEAHVLPPGVVCDACNNYFATKVEQPFLEAPVIRGLRLRQGIPNKRGRVPSVRGLLWPNYPLEVTREPGLGGSIILDCPDATVTALLSHPGGRLILPSLREHPRGPVVSRFLAKCGLEALATRWLDPPQMLDELVDHRGFDPLREHARRGQPREWEHSMRVIYDENALAVDRGRPEQILHEYDILLTSPARRRSDDYIESEAYFVLALFGVELVINMGGPEIDGYKRWLAANNGVSPLYSGRNAQPRP